MEDASLLFGLTLSTHWQAATWKELIAMHERCLGRAFMRLMNQSIMLRALIPINPEELQKEDHTRLSSSEEHEQLHPSLDT
jgi:hypothetical protein